MYSGAHHVVIYSINPNSGVRRGRTAQDISSCRSVVTTVQNRLTSLVRSLKTHLVERITTNPTPKVIQEMGKCMDLGDILEVKETEKVNEERKKSLRNVMNKAQYDQGEQRKIVEEYEVFKSRMKDLNDPKSETEVGEIRTRFEHILFKTHSCHPGCKKILQADGGRGPGSRIMVCPDKGNLLQPREPRLMKMLHLMYKEPSLYIGIKHFLHLFLRYKLYKCQSEV
jgi:hypothetical protein